MIDEQRLLEIKNDLNRIKLYALQQTVESDIINGVDIAIAAHPKTLPIAWQYVDELLGEYLKLTQ